MYKLLSLTKTCDACPTQWEGKLIDGRMLYFRYRWGVLNISISHKITDDIYDAVNGNTIFSERIGGGYDGILDYNELINKTKHLNFF